MRSVCAKASFFLRTSFERQSEHKSLPGSFLFWPLWKPCEPVKPAALKGVEAGHTDTNSTCSRQKLSRLQQAGIPEINQCGSGD